MDLDEWELLLDDEFLEIHDDGGNNNILSRRRTYGSNCNDFMANNYFVSPSEKFPDSMEVVPRPPTKQIIDDHPVPLNPEEMGGDHDAIIVVSQVSFKKIMRENEFVDMKMDSPKSSSSSRTALPQIDLEREMGKKKKKSEEEEEEEVKKGKEGESDGGRLNIWKWSSTGIGAICSFGVAAATLCFIVFVNGGNPGEKKKNNQKLLRFQIDDDDDKRIKQLNEAMGRAHMTVESYYDDAISF